MNEATPIACLVGERCSADAEAVLSAAGWRVRIADGGRAVPDLTAGRPVAAVVLIDADLPDADRPDPDIAAADVIEAIRGGTGAASAVPLLAYARRGAERRRALYAQGFDGIVPAGQDAGEIVRALDAWRLDDPAAALDRLESTFGVAPVEALVARFAVLLGEAIAALDRGDAREIAHRVAGGAGTLGFAAAGRAWLAIEEGDAITDVLEDGARRETRRALASIAQR